MGFYWATSPAQLARCWARAANRTPRIPSLNPRRASASNRGIWPRVFRCSRASPWADKWSLFWPRPKSPTRSSSFRLSDRDRICWKYVTSRIIRDYAKTSQRMRMGRQNNERNNWILEKMCSQTKTLALLRINETRVTTARSCRGEDEYVVQKVEECLPIWKKG